MKKLLSAAVAVVLAATLISPALAHGPHHGGTARSAGYSVCAAEDCLKIGLHTHSGRAYTSHYYGDGHDYHGYCDFENCTLTGYHEHDGTYCFGHSQNDGHRYHNKTGRGHH